MISEAQEIQIIDKVKAAGIGNKKLSDDLIDHIYCLTEIQMDKGDDFDIALEKAMKQTAPEGLKQIENQTIFLLNKSKIMLMKRSMYLSGYMFSVLWITGIGLKLLHLQGGALIMAAGAFGITFLFIPLFIINRYKALASELLTEKLKWTFGLACIGLLVTAITMKFLHLPGAGMMLMTSLILFVTGILPFQFFNMYKQSLREN